MWLLPPSLRLAPSLRLVRSRRYHARCAMCCGPFATCGVAPVPSTLRGVSDAAVNAFWRQAREEITDLPEAPAAAWPFGATAAHADSLLELVLARVKTGTATALWDLHAEGESVPEVGELSVILDGSGLPRAIIETTAIATVPFGEVSAEHAHAEGEGDRTLEAWRDIHERYWRAHALGPHGFAPDMPIVCERFRLRYPSPASRAG